MRRLVIGIACAGASIIGPGVGIVSAGQPTEAGCVGESVSANARAIHPYGALIRGFTPRNDLGTLADAVHALQAGQVPDEVFANTCN